VVAALTLAWLAGGPARAAEDQAEPQLNEAQRLVFLDDHLRGVAEGAVLSYAFRSAGEGMEGFSDKVTVKVTGVREGGGRDLEFEFLSGERRVDFRPAQGYVGNPVIIHFLERDIRDMARATGGDIAYFRNRVRRSFTEPGVRRLTVPLEGREVEATRVTVTPYLGDPNIERFPTYAQKRYEFVLSDRIPGGVYSIRTVLPAEGEGPPRIEERLTFQRITPAG
jgi:hypothetical protein